MRFFECGVEERHQFVTKLQKFSNDVFVVLAEPPRLLIVAFDIFVIAAEGREKRDLIPARKHLACISSYESASVAANERLARQAQPLKHRNPQPQRVPRAA